jgi:hypothetical protein
VRVGAGHNRQPVFLSINLFEDLNPALQISGKRFRLIQFLPGSEIRPIQIEDPNIHIFGGIHCLHQAAFQVNDYFKEGFIGRAVFTFAPNEKPFQE